MISTFIQLLFNRIIFGYYASKNIKNDIISKPNILQWLSLCVFIPIQEEIMYRYAFYHLLEKFFNDTMTINIVNGIFFGLLHVSNGLVIEMKPLDYLMIIIANGHLGYLLAVSHDNLVLCMIIHGLYNFIGISLILYTNKGNIMDKIKDNIYIYTQPRRRAISLGYTSKFDFIHKIKKSKVNKDTIESISKYDHIKNEHLRKNSLRTE